MLPRLFLARLKTLSLMAGAGAVALSASLVHAQTTGGGGATTGGGGGTTGGGGGGGGGVGAGKSVGANGPGGQSAQALGPGTNFSPAQATATNTAGATGANSSAMVPSTFNPFRASYSNPYAIGATSGGAVGYNNAGKSGAAAAKAFGQPVFATSTTGTGIGGTQGLGGAGGIKGLTGSGSLATNTSAVGFDTAAMRKTPGYTTSLSEEFPLPIRVPSQLTANVRGVLDRSSQLRSQGTIQVRVENEVVVLTGTVATDRERRLAENLIRLSPGVADVVNELQVR